MAKKPIITDVSSGFQSDSTLDSNFTNLRDGFDNTLSLDGSTPNAMGADLDLDSNDILNAGTVNTNTLKVGGVSLGVAGTSSVPSWTGNWLTATSYQVNDLMRNAGSTYIAVTAHTSGVVNDDITSGYWELFAERGSSGAGTGDLVSTNNLSDLDDDPTARTNLGLGTLAVENTAPIAQGGTGQTTASAAFEALKQAATTTDTGVVEAATTAEAEAGTAAGKFPDVVKVKEAIAALAPASSGSHVFIETLTASNDSSLEFTNTDNTEYIGYVFDFQSMDVLSVTRNLQIRFSTDGGTSYISASNSYRWNNQISNGTTADYSTNLAATSVVIGGATPRDIASGSSGPALIGKFTIYNPHVSSTYTSIQGNGGYSGDSSSLEVLQHISQSVVATEHNAFEISATTGNITGSVNIYGIKA